MANYLIPLYLYYLFQSTNKFNYYIMEKKNGLSTVLEESRSERLHSSITYYTYSTQEQGMKRKIAEVGINNC